MWLQEPAPPNKIWGGWILLNKILLLSMVEWRKSSLLDKKCRGADTCDSVCEYMWRKPLGVIKNLLVQWISKADTIGAKKTRPCEEIFLWEFDLKSVCCIPRNSDVRYIEVSALHHVRFREIPLRIINPLTAQNCSQSESDLFPALITYQCEAIVVSLSDIVHRCVFMCKISHIGQLKG